jgi:hypothetical protein
MPEFFLQKKTAVPFTKLPDNYFFEIQPVTSF